MSKQSKNDEKILELKAQIKEKKAKLKGKKRFVPVTNCSLEIDGIRFNLNVLSKEALTILLLKLHGLKMAANELDIEDVIVSGYTLSDWIDDIQLKLTVTNQRIEETKLQQLESKLDVLLSNEKKVELEIDSILAELD